MLAEDFLHDGVVGHSILDRVDATGRFQSDDAARLLVVLLDGLSHDVNSFRSGPLLLLSCGCLDVVSTRVHRQQGRFLHVAETAQVAGFEDHLHGHLAACLLQFIDVVGQSLVVAAEELAHRQHDIHVGGAVFDGQRSLGDLHLYKCL